MDNQEGEKQENELLVKFKDFIHKNSLIIESILAVIIIVMFVAIIGTNTTKERLEGQNYELQAKLEDTSKTLQAQIEEKDNKIKDNEKYTLPFVRGIQVKIKVTLLCPVRLV